MKNFQVACNEPARDGVAFCQRSARALPNGRKSRLTPPRARYQDLQLLGRDGHESHGMVRALGRGYGARRRPISHEHRGREPVAK